MLIVFCDSAALLERCPALRSSSTDACRDLEVGKSLIMMGGTMILPYDMGLFSIAACW